MAGSTLAGFGGRHGLWVGMLALETAGLALAFLLIRHAARDVQLAAEPSETGETEGFWAAWWAGMRMMGHTRAYRILLPFGLLEAAATAGIGFALMFVVLDTLNAGAAWYGTVTAAMAAGSALGFAIAERLPASIPFWVLLVISNTGMTAALAAATFTRSALVLTIAMATMSAFQSLINPAFQAIFMTAVPEQYLGRAYSTFATIVDAVSSAAIPAWTIVAAAISTWGATGDGYTAILGLVTLLHIVLAGLSLTGPVRRLAA